MGTIKLLTDVNDVSRAAGDRWYVTNGVTPVGPVHFDLVARGIEAGKVPMESFIRHETWRVWRPLSEIAAFTDDIASVVPTREPRFIPQSMVSVFSDDDDDEVTLPGRAGPPRASRPDEGVKAP